MELACLNPSVFLLQFEHLCLFRIVGFPSVRLCFFLCVYFRRSKRGAGFLLKEFEAENFQCVDVVSMLVGGVVELF